MSHFSKIKTNINDLDNLTKTIKQLGFCYKLLHNDVSNSNDVQVKNVMVYQSYQNDNQCPLFNFSWSGDEYILIADVQLWSLEVDFSHFIDRLFQQYAYNQIVNASCNYGFSKIQENLSYDGSIKVTLQRWSRT
uniref:Uncharacterized protein ycf35 n=1 Tax=Herposiphonia versicolor TaxID=2007163 RepID=A0A1Z1MF42_9FLOR|nr:hypothetical protein [Herposiphonia versicolor]ARW64697.1 hypothetical protein [Herposiphonia versicolor]